MAEGVRADVALAARGLARSRTEAAAMVKAGEVLVDGRPVRRPSQPIPDAARLELRSTGPRYVSRAAHKLVSALDAFPVAVSGRRALDAGASTGGFTQVLLDRGAARVAAVDVGHDQLVAALRADPRVDVHEGTNVRDLVPADIGGPVDLVVSDLSFISLRLVLPALAGVCTPTADLLLMVKPQFEVGRAALPRSGVVTDPDARREAVVGVVEAALHAGLRPCGVARSGLPGQDGNVEFFLHLRAGTEAGASAEDGGGDAPGAVATSREPAEERARALVAASDVAWG